MSFMNFGLSLQVSICAQPHHPNLRNSKSNRVMTVQFCAFITFVVSNGFVVVFMTCSAAVSFVFYSFGLSNLQTHGAVTHLGVLLQFVLSVQEVKTDTLAHWAGLL